MGQTPPRSVDTRTTRSASSMTIYQQALKRLPSARVISAGHAFVQNLRRSHYELGVESTRSIGSRRSSPNSRVPSDPSPTSATPDRTRPTQHRRSGAVRRPAVRRRGWIQCCLTRSRCHRKIVAGMRIRCSWQAGDRSRVSAANTARSAHDSRGLRTWRRNTATSCRSTRISTFFELELRASSPSHATSCRKRRQQSYRHDRRSCPTATVTRCRRSPLWMSYSAPTRVEVSSGSCARRRRLAQKSFYTRCGIQPFSRSAYRDQQSLGPHRITRFA
jgi:hypothetical protein